MKANDVRAASGEKKKTWRQIISCQLQLKAGWTGTSQLFERV